MDIIRGVHCRRSYISAPFELLRQRSHKLYFWRHCTLIFYSGEHLIKIEFSKILHKLHKLHCAGSGNDVHKIHPTLRSQLFGYFYDLPVDHVFGHSRSTARVPGDRQRYALYVEHHDFYADCGD